MQDEETIKQPQDVIEQEARLAKYENAHTPPSLKRGRNRKKIRTKAATETLVRRLGTKV